MTQRILLADDSATIRKVVELTFSGEDVTVTAVGDGARALERARAERPDIVISEVHLPGLDGYELCERLKADGSLRGVPFLFLRGALESFDEERAGACGADGSIVKPFEAGEMIRKVRELIAGAAAAPPAAPQSRPLAPPRFVPPAAPAAAAVPPAPPARPAPTSPPPRPATVPSRPPVPPPSSPAPAAPIASSHPGIAAPPAPPPLPPPARPVRMPPPAPFTDEDFDFGPVTPEPAAVAGPGDDLWSEVSLRGGPVPAIEAAGGEDTFWGSLADATALDEQGAPAAPAEPVAVTAAPRAPALDPTEVERLVAARLDAAVRRALEPLVAGMARPLLEEIAWQVVPELAEAMIRAEIERIARSADTG